MLVYVIAHRVELRGQAEVRELRFNEENEALLHVVVVINWEEEGRVLVKVRD
jgi:hypothetical protein